MSDTMAESPNRRKHKTDRPLLSVREIRFCQLYADTGVKVRSYIDAGLPHGTYDSAAQLVRKLLRKVQIREYIRQIQQEAMDKAQVTYDRVVQGLARIAFADRTTIYDEQGRIKPFRQWPADVRSTVEGVESEDLFEEVPGSKPKRKELRGYTRVVKTAKRVEALKALAQILKMIGPDTTSTGKDGHPPLVIGGDANPDSIS